VEKRVVFRSAWLPYALVAPQIVITILFFFWPAVQAVWYSFQMQDAFGLKTQFVGSPTTPRCSRTATTSPRSRSRRCSAAGGVLGHRHFAAARNHGGPCCAGALAYKTLLIWPYGGRASDRRACCGLSCSRPPSASWTYVLKGWGINWNWLVDGDQGLLLW
jgi:sn-glycerol 3-phosphate transport system permease protein